MDVYSNLINMVSDSVGIPAGELRRKARYPVTLYRYMIFRYLTSLGFTHECISELSGFKRPSVTYGIKIANFMTGSQIDKNFNRIIKEYNDRCAERN